MLFLAKLGSKVIDEHIFRCHECEKSEENTDLDQGQEYNGSEKFAAIDPKNGGIGIKLSKVEDLTEKEEIIYRS